MLIPTVITSSIALFLGGLSAAQEKLFLLLMFAGLPAFGVAVKFIDQIRLPFRTPDGANIIERIKDLFFQIPEEYRLGFFLFAPAFIIGRLVAASMVSTHKSKQLTPAQIRAKKEKIMKSYAGQF